MRALLMVLSALFAASCPVAAAPCDHCSLVLIGLDDVRADRVGAPGSRTPRLDAFFAGGAVFTQAVSQAPWTLPSFMSVMTGRHPSRHGVINKYADASVDPPVPAALKAASPETQTLAEVLRSRGWRTAAFTGGAGLTGAAGFAAGFEVYSDSSPFAGFAATAPQALDWLKTLRPGERFFLFVHGYDSHPFHSGRSPAAADVRFRRRRREQLEGRAAASGPEEKAETSSLYDAAIGGMDARLAPLLDALDGPGLRGRVIVAAFADHGEELFDHGGVDHGRTLYEELLRVPLLLRGPGLRPRRISSQVRLIDLLPTVLDLLGVKEPAAVCAQRDGVSLTPLLSGRPLTLDAFSETDFLLRVSLRSLRTWDGWKLIHDQQARRSRLYDLKTDPAETIDLSEREAQKLLRLEERLLSSYDPEPVDAGARSVCAGSWKLVREGSVERLYDLRMDPFQKTDVAARHPDLARRLAARLTPPPCAPGTSGKPGSPPCR